MNLNNNNKDKNKHKKKKRNKRGKKNESDSDDDNKNNNNEENKNEDESSYGGSSIMSKSTNYQKNGIIERIEFNEKEKERIERLHSIRIKIISNENKEKNNDAEIIEITSFLCNKINFGYIWLCYYL